MTEVAAFWFAVAAAVISVTTFALNFLTNKNKAEIDLLKTTQALQTAELNKLKVEHEHCRLESQQLREEILSLMRKLIFAKILPDDPFKKG